jgi:hypothetical protein
MSVYLDVVENYDTVKPSRKKGAGDTLTFEKRVNGGVVVVQQVRSGKQEFAFFDMWIKKSEKEKKMISPGPTDAPSIEGPRR